MYAALQKPQYYTTTTNYNYVYDKLRTDISNHASVTNYNLYFVNSFDYYDFFLI